MAEAKLTLVIDGWAISREIVLRWLTKLAKVDPDLSPWRRLGQNELSKAKDIAYRMSVLTLDTSISYNFLTAYLICGLLDRLSTMKTRVLLSSIFFMADSVVRGNFTILNWSSLEWN